MGGIVIWPQNTTEYITGRFTGPLQKQPLAATPPILRQADSLTVLQDESGDINCLGWLRLAC